LASQNFTSQHWSVQPCVRPERRIERYWRDARLTTIFEGTSEIQRRISDRMLPRA
jgi:alkylation response protein AidB-like acyl-CoA dehydrogenase